MSELDLGHGTALPVDAVTETFALIGTRGAGKSSAARVLVEELHKARQPFVVLDPKGDWWGLRSNATGSGPGLPVPVFGGEHGDVPLEPTAGTLLADVVVGHGLSCVLDLSAMSKTKARAFGTDFAERLYRANRDPLMLVVDEADVLIPQHKSADTMRLLGAYEDIAKRGRNRGLGMVIATQRGADVSKSVLELVETLVVLKVVGPRTRKAVVEWIDDHSDDPDVIRTMTASLSSLPVGQGWLYSPGWLGKLTRVRFRRIRTFDSHATPRAGEARRVPSARAAVDLAALGAEIAATAEQAKANDPAELRRRIAALERDTAAKVAALERELVNAGQAEPERVEVTVEVPVVPVEVLSALAAAEQAVQAATEAATAAIPTRAPLEVTTHMPSRPRETPEKPARPPGRTRRSAATSPVAAPRSGPADVPGNPPAIDPPLKAGARRILDTFAAHHPLRLTVGQLATLARFKTSGGTWRDYWGRIRREGLVDETAAGWGLTDAGLAYVGGTRAPMTADELVASWRSALKEGARTILDELMAVHPDGLTREQIGQRLDREYTGGTFRDYVGTLKRNGLADEAGGVLYASDTLYLGAAS